MTKRRGSSRKERTSDVGKYLTQVRVAQGKTQQELADKLGKSRSCICKIETGERAQKSLQGVKLYQLAAAYGAPIVDILKKAKWAQLPLFDIRANNEHGERDPLLDVTDEERRELIRYLNEIRGEENE